MKRIAIVSLENIANWGDHFLKDTVSFIVKNRFPEAELVMLDLEASINHNLLYYFTGAINKIINKIMSMFPKSNLMYRIRFYNMKLRLKRHYSKLLKGVDAFIFAGGSFKYGTQRVWIRYSIFIECCEEKKIPVMFNAVNIQEYKHNDWRCQCLKEHLNYPCVKYITTRDGPFGVKRLISDYITKSNIACSEAGDPGLWIPECYGIQRKPGEVVGINLIRPSIFNGYSFSGAKSDNDIISLYEDLISYLINSGINFELFTNGLPSDARLLDKIQERGKFTQDLHQYLYVPANARELAERISKYKIVWAARLHACICAISFNVPVVCFAWDEKILHFANYVGIEQSLILPSQMDSKTAITKLNDCLNNCTDWQYDWPKLNKLKMLTSDTICEFIEMKK